MSRKQYSPQGLGVKASSLIALLILSALTGLPACAANFSFSTLIRLGSATAGVTELQAGTNTADISNYLAFTGGAGGAINPFTVQYTKATNTATLSVTGLGSVSFNPTGGSAVAANATWTLASGSFVVTSSNFNQAIQVSNLALSGVTGAINILSPLQSTTLTASRTLFGGNPDFEAQPGNVVFVGDANGNWRLTGNLLLIDLTGAGGPSDLTFGLSASATGAAVVPEPSTYGTLSIGLILLAAKLLRAHRKGKSALQS